jgi:hypothetical protein
VSNSFSSDPSVASGTVPAQPFDPWYPVLKQRDDGGAHYSVFGLRNADYGIEALRRIFPDGRADSMNFVLFSTSGIHGTYSTIEECDPSIPEEDRSDDVTFLVVHPRIVCLKYGNCKPETPEDFAFLKKLRESSYAAVAQIGRAA